MRQGREHHAESDYGVGKRSTTSRWRTAAAVGVNAAMTTAIWYPPRYPIMWPSETCQPLMQPDSDKAVPGSNAKVQWAAHGKDENKTLT